MKHRALSAALALIFISSLISGCAGHSLRSQRHTFTDFGIVEISNGVPITRTLADGRTCTIVPTILNHTTIQVTVTADSQTAASTPCTATLATTLPADEKTIFSLDSHSTISMTLHEPEQN